MGVIAEFSVGADAFELGSILGGDYDVSIRMEPVVPTLGDVIPYLWASGDVDRFEQAMAELNCVDRIAVVEREDDRRLYRVHWDPLAEELLAIFDRTDGTLLEARGTDRWYFTVRFPNDESVTQFHEWSRRASYDLDLHRLGRSTDGFPQSEDEYDLTTAQREALVRAVEGGYFSIPRQSTLDDIADAFDISNQAASERIRRATESILEQVLADDFETVTNGP